MRLLVEGVQTDLLRSSWTFASDAQICSHILWFRVHSGRKAESRWDRLLHTVHCCPLKFLPSGLREFVSNSTLGFYRAPASSSTIWLSMNLGPAPLSGLTSPNMERSQEPTWMTAAIWLPEFWGKSLKRRWRSSSGHTWSRKKCRTTWGGKSGQLSLKTCWIHDSCCPCSV